MTPPAPARAPDAGRPRRIATIPDTSGRNPYFRLFYEALARHGFKHIGGAECDPAWLRVNARDVDWLHVHWVQYVYENASLLLSAQGAVRLIRFLAAARRQGLGLVWTMHNVFPHETRSRAVDLMVRLALARLADVVVVLTEAARRPLGRYFGRRGNVITVPHGHFIDCYPGKTSRQEARARLGLPADAFVCLLFGAVRPYKGSLDLVRALRTLPDRDVVVVLAGEAWPESLAQELRRAAAADSRLRLYLEAIPDQDVPFYFGAADLATFPFSHVLSSGSLMLALSMGVPVLIPDLASLREYVSPEVGYVMPRAEDLGVGLRRAREALASGRIVSGEAVKTWAGRFDWETAVVPLVRALQQRRGEK